MGECEQNAWKIELPICTVMYLEIYFRNSDINVDLSPRHSKRFVPPHTRIYIMLLLRNDLMIMCLCAARTRKTCANGSKVRQRTFIDRSDETSIAFITFTAINRNVNAYANWRYFTCETTYHTVRIDHNSDSAHLLYRLKLTEYIRLKWNEYCIHSCLSSGKWMKLMLNIPPPYSYIFAELIKNV